MIIENFPLCLAHLNHNTQTLVKPFGQTQPNGLFSTRQFNDLNNSIRSIHKPRLKHHKRSKISKPKMGRTKTTTNSFPQPRGLQVGWMTIAMGVKAV